MQLRGWLLCLALPSKWRFPSSQRLSCRVSFLAAFAAVWLAPRSWLLCFLVATWALATALSRALMGRHYLSDVMAGLALGLMTATLTTRVRLAS